MDSVDMADALQALTLYKEYLEYREALAWEEANYSHTDGTYEEWLEQTYTQGHPVSLAEDGSPF